MTSPDTVFVAYGSQSDAVTQAIEGGIHNLLSRKPRLKCRSWRSLEISGKEISPEVLDAINLSDCLVADVSILNCNVLFEIGYAIARCKPVFLLVNASIAKDPDFAEIGLLDTVGHTKYTNAHEFCTHIAGIDRLTPLPISKQKDKKAPVYLNLGKHRTDYETKIVSGIKKQRVYFRSFDPAETPRLSAVDAISNVTSSYGVLVHFLPPEIDGARVNNLRAAFLAGLGYGLEIPYLFIQSGTDATPIDYRDLVQVCLHPNQYKELIAEFSTEVLEALQQSTGLAVVKHDSFLESLNLGASSAENELAVLGEYYIEIDAFLRAKRKEVRLITGRKGSGKTAVFFQLRDKIRSHRSNIVLDLKPDGYQLLKFKDSVLRAMAGGTVEHTLTAFWEYLLLLEICYKLLEKDQENHKRDHRLFEPYQRLRAHYERDEYVGEGDFSERLVTLLDSIAQDFEAQFQDARDITLDAGEVTQLLYRHDVAKLRTEVYSYLKFKDELWLLFDNIDKGWPTHGLASTDLVIVRTLIEATRKIERELENKGLDVHTVIFLRNDVYELLIGETPDRGKETRANVDWDDPEMLRELLRRRIIFSENLETNPSFDELWRQIVAPVVFGQESSQYLIDRSLMRPRCLIDLINHCRSYAINLQHSKISEDDILKGLKAYSTSLLSDICLEIRDVFPTHDDTLYAFIGSMNRLSAEEVRLLCVNFQIKDIDVERFIELLLWFGFLGVVWNESEVKYIYNVSYDFKLLQGLCNRRAVDGLLYQINPAFWLGLEVDGETQDRLV